MKPLIISDSLVLLSEKPRLMETYKNWSGFGQISAITDKITLTLDSCL